MPTAEEFLQVELARELRQRIRAYKEERRVLMGAMARLAVLNQLIARAEDMAQPLHIVAAPDIE